MAESQRPAPVHRYATVVPRRPMQQPLASDFEACRRSCTRGLEPGGKTRSPVSRQMQRRPGVWCAVHEAMTRDVITGVEAVEIHAHSREFLAPVIRKRAQLFI